MPKKIFLGWSKGRGNPQPWLHFEVPSIMISAFDFHLRNGEGTKASETLGFAGEIFCDSGGYQYISTTQSITSGQALQVQKQLGATLNAALDHPFDPRKHLEYFKFYLESSQSGEYFSFVPVVPQDLPAKFIREMAAAFPNPPLVAIGKIVPALFPLADHRKVERVLRNIHRIREFFPSAKIHALGVGGVTTAILLFHLVDSIDTSSWLHDARYGKMRLLGGGIAKSSQPGSRPNRMLLDNIEDCGCPGCKNYSVEILTKRGIEGMQARALHNAWVLLREQDRINQMIGGGVYQAYAASRAAKSTWHRNFYDLVKRLL
jgi:queuine/archaeosine tRNA-ribosyltransferase